MQHAERSDCVGSSEALCNTAIPISLYVHFPWCVRKCPYCDFNSFEAKSPIPQAQYLSILMRELEARRQLTGPREFSSIFFGGGTPSLMSAASVRTLISAAMGSVGSDSKEITLESNPGAADAEHFAAYREAGVNRLSIGAQSFRDQYLRAIGRIHSAEQTNIAVQTAKSHHFPHLNLDLMFGLPGDSVQGMLFDLECAIALDPDHISWYSFTIEPNTHFAAHPPELPEESEIADAFLLGQELLARAGYVQYEISAYARQGAQCVHNLNYWHFGDYLGIGAGAHSKLTLPDGDIVRAENWRAPQKYMTAAEFREMRSVEGADRLFEFFLNALRLTQGFSIETVVERTGLCLEAIENAIRPAIRRELISFAGGRIVPTPLGQRFLNDLQAMFLPECVTPRNS